MTKGILKVLAMAAIVIIAASCSKERDSIYQGSNAETGSGTEVGTGEKRLIADFNIRYEKVYEGNSISHTIGLYQYMTYTWESDKLMGYTFKHSAPSMEETGTINYDGDKPIEVIVNYVDGEDDILSITYVNGLMAEIGSYSFSYTDDGKLSNVMINNTMRQKFTWTGDNLTGEQYYYNGQLSENYTYVYDSKKQPLLMPLWLCVHGLTLTQDFPRLSKNNVIYGTCEGYTISGGNAYNNTYSYTYTYDGDYPTKYVRSCTYRNSDVDYDVETITTYYEYSDGTGVSQHPKIYDIIGTENNSSWGYVRGGGQYEEGSQVVLKAYTSGSSSHEFMGWSDGNTDNPRTVIANADATYTAIFSE